MRNVQGNLISKYGISPREKYKSHFSHIIIMQSSHVVSIMRYIATYVHGYCTCDSLVC